MKCCNKCKLEKTKSEFGVNNARSDKLTIWCKQCEKLNRELKSLIPKITANSKKCNKCDIEKPISEFRRNRQKKDGYSYTCKSCLKNRYALNINGVRDRSIAACRYYSINNKEALALLNKRYYQNNRERTLARIQGYQKRNSEKIRARKSLYSINNAEKIKQADKARYDNNKEILNKKSRDYYAKNRDYILEKTKERAKLIRPELTIKQRNRRKNDAFYAFKTRICNLIRMSISKNGYKKEPKTYEILGCTYEEFKAHIENQFANGMSWENRSAWHLDHIYPISLAKDEQEVIRLNHYSNFQPLWMLDNLRKGNKALSPSPLLNRA